MKGATLLELLLALLLSFLLFSLLVTLYLAQQEHFQLKTDLVRLHQGAQRALSLLHEDLQMAGYLGCPHLRAALALKNTTALSLTSKTKLSFDGNLLVVKHRSLKAVPLLQPMETPNTLFVSEAASFSEGQLLLLSDCQHADLFEVATIEKDGQRQRLTPKVPLGYLYREGAELGFMEVKRYSLENSGRYDQNGQPLQALYLTQGRNNKQEIIEGVTDFAVSATYLSKEGLNESPLAELEGAKVLGISTALTLKAGKWHKIEYDYVFLRD